MRSAVATAALVALSLSAIPASADIIRWEATLTPDQEIAPPDITGFNPTGSATVQFDDVSNILGIDFSWSGLTGDATAAHIHCCVVSPPGNAGVVLGFWNPPPDVARPPDGAYSNSWDLDVDDPFTAAFVTANGGTPLLAFVTGLMPALSAGMPGLGQAYFNIHTAQNSAGEIRGDIIPAQVPEPASVLLLMSGVALACRRRSRMAAVRRAIALDRRD